MSQSNFYFEPFFQPGIYAIVNKKTDMWYIGQASTLA